jgi:hypothetical protein
MKKLRLAVSLFAFTLVGLGANAFADHPDTVKQSEDNVENVAADLLNEAGGAANRMVGEASDAVNRVGQHLNDGYKKLKDKAK